MHAGLKGRTRPVAAAVVRRIVADRDRRALLDDLREERTGAIVGIVSTAGVPRNPSDRAVANSAAEAKRCAGCFASAVSSARSAMAGSAGLIERGGGKGSRMCAATMAKGVSARNGTRPVSSS